jgi:riboflavin kinase/FMN adenylyltransferase
MELIRGLHNLRGASSGCVATIGNFDGLHRGHQEVLGQVARKAAELALPSAVISFEPHPQEFFRPDEAPARLSMLREKLEGMAALSVDRLLVLRFDQHLAGLSAEAFVERVLFSGLQVRYLVIGDDFCFGRQRAGNYRLLEEMGRRLGFSVAHTNSYEIDGERVSSTRVRSALAAGDLSLTERLLGRPYTVTGRVVHGDARGRTIGFPTANVPLRRSTSPVRGVFAVRLHGAAAHPLAGVANAGNRPTVDGGRRTLLEVHLFDFDGDLYRRRVAVELVSRLRDERRFASLEALRAQIEVDAQQARAMLGS